MNCARPSAVFVAFGVVAFARKEARALVMAAMVIIVSAAAAGDLCGNETLPTPARARTTAASVSPM